MENHQTEKSIEGVEFATVEGLTNRRFLEPLGWVPPAENESMYYLGQSANEGGQTQQNKLIMRG